MTILFGTQFGEPVHHPGALPQSVSKGLERIVASYTQIRRIRELHPKRMKRVMECLLLSTSLRWSLRIILASHLYQSLIQILSLFFSRRFISPTTLQIVISSSFLIKSMNNN